MASKLVFEDEGQQAQFSSLDLTAMRHEVGVQMFWIGSVTGVQSPKGFICLESLLCMFYFFHPFRCNVSLN
jgi:hypothetical protein